jgi:hypothetical protein
MVPTHGLSHIALSVSTALFLVCASTSAMTPPFRSWGRDPMTSLLSKDVLLMRERAAESSTSAFDWCARKTLIVQSPRLRRRGEQWFPEASLGLGSRMLSSETQTTTTSKSGLNEVSQHAARTKHSRMAGVGWIGDDHFVADLDRREQYVENAERARQNRACGHVVGDRTAA